MLIQGLSVVDLVGVCPSPTAFQWQGCPRGGGVRGEEDVGGVVSTKKSCHCARHTIALGDMLHSSASSVNFEEHDVPVILFDL